MSDLQQIAGLMDVVVHDCWNSIGVRGDGSCPQLKQYVRCLNCPTFAVGASSLLDRPALLNSAADNEAATLFAQSAASQATDGTTFTRGRGDATASMLVFRVGAEWLSLPTTAIVEVIEARAVHSLPHQSNLAVLGLTNIRGALKLCVSLARMLGIDDGAHAGQRLLVVMHEDQTLVFPVNEVSGVQGYAATAVQPPPATLAQTSSTYTQAIVAWHDKKVGLLDCGLLFYALNRSLT